MTNCSDRHNQSAPSAVTPASHQTPVFDHAYQTISSRPSTTTASTIPTSLTHPVPSSAPGPLPSQLSYPHLHSTPASSPAQPSHVTKPAVFYVPRNPRQVLDFSPNSYTPESKAKRALLSIDPNQNAIALVGMGGAGKTTILRALGRNPDVWTKFPDGVWFIQLGHDATVQKLLDQLKVVVTEAFPTFIPRFTELAATENTHVLMMEKLVDLLAQKQFLLMFDDVWDVDPNVYTLVDSACQAVQGIEKASCKVLTSTRNEKVGRVPTHDVSISVSPELSRRETCVEIFCCYAGIQPHTLPSFSSPNRDALDKIIDFCAGLPLALSVAGSALQDVLGTRTDVCGPDGIAQYWESLQKSRTQVSDAEGGNRHVGLNAALQLSLESMEKEWKGKSMTVGEMFRSFCVMEKQMSLPLCAIEKLWGVNDGLVGVRMFSRHSVVSLDVDKKGLIVGVRLHDLVHDLCVEMAKGSEGVGTWHARFVDAYRASIRTCEVANDEQVDEESNSTAGEEWWKLGSKDKYMIDNVVRHLVGAGQATDALQLLTEYRWIEEMNDNKEQLPFQKIISELQLLRMHLKKSAKTEMCRRVMSDIGIVERAMVLCMVPYCVRNRKECTFQLYGRLRDVSSESVIVERIICSIERYGRRPWARAGPGVLSSGRSSLKRVLEHEGRGRCICTGAGEEVVVGGCEGTVHVLNSRDGKLKKSLIGYEEYDEVANVFFDRSSELIYSCSRKGQVIIWKEYEKWRSMEAELQHEEESSSMQVLPSVGKLVVGTSRGRLVVMDINSGTTIQTVNAHKNLVSSLAVSGSEDIMVSGSWDRNIHVWETESFEDSARVFEGHADCVNCVALTRDGNLLASGSHDKTIRIWDVRSGENLWMSHGQTGDEVQSVLFSSDGHFLYSASLLFMRMWRVSNDGRDASLMQTLPNALIYSDCMFCIRDDSELFGVRGRKVQVWDAQPVSSSNEQDDVFLPGVVGFAVSEDAATMLTWNLWSECLEIRSMEDVSQQTDRVISSCKIPNHSRWLDPLAVSNNRRFVAFRTGPRNCTVHITDLQNGNVLHSFSDLDDWALSLTPDGEEVSSNSSSYDDSSSASQLDPNRGIESTWFSPDCSLISAIAIAWVDGEIGAVESKSMSWNVSSGELFHEVQPDGDSTASNIAANPRLVCNRKIIGEILTFPSNVTYKEGDSSFTIASMGSAVHGAHYFPDTSRLFFSSFPHMYHIDLVIDSTQFPRRDEPPLPPLSQPHPHPRPSDEVYDVFISHAGTDKLTIAKPLYDLLVALGFKVFLDMAELRPGQEAPEKMINAMRTAKIAVVILSPEFAARKWTLKELMCFLERFHQGGEHEVIIIPVFYRLTLNDCRDENSLFSLVDEKGESVFMKEGFLQRMAKEREYGVGDVLKALQSLRNITGIENKNRVTNGDSAAEKAAQRKFVEEIRDAIVEAMGRRKSGTTVGLNLAQWFSCTIA